LSRQKAPPGIGTMRFHRGKNLRPNESKAVALPARAVRDVTQNAE
jgi:hypothetical protein